MTTKIAERATSEEVEAAVGILKLLADPTRLRVLQLLDGRECSVAELAEEADAAPTAVSQHLAKLRLGGLVLTRRDGNRIFYRLVSSHVARLVNEALLQADHLVGGARHHRGDHQ